MWWHRKTIWVSTHILNYSSQKCIFPMYVKDFCQELLLHHRKKMTKQTFSHFCCNVSIWWCPRRFSPGLFRSPWNVFFFLMNFHHILTIFYLNLNFLTSLAKADHRLSLTGYITNYKMQHKDKLFWSNTVPSHPFVSRWVRWKIF